MPFVKVVEALLLENSRIESHGTWCKRQQIFDYSALQIDWFMCIPCRVLVKKSETVTFCSWIIDCFAENEFFTKSIMKNFLCLSLEFLRRKNLYFWICNRHCATSVWVCLCLASLKICLNWCDDKFCIVNKCVKVSNFSFLNQHL